jgi:hypothetical protein
MTDIYIIKETDVLQTRFNDEDVTITVKDLKKLDFIPSTPKPRIEFQSFWEEFVIDFLNIRSIRDMSSEQKQQITGFIKDNIKSKLLKKNF